MKIEYYHAKKQEDRLLNTDDIEIDLENGHLLRVFYHSGSGMNIQVLDKNKREKIIDKTVDAFVFELKGEK